MLARMECAVADLCGGCREPLPRDSPLGFAAQNALLTVLSVCSPKGKCLTMENCLLMVEFSLDEKTIVNVQPSMFNGQLGFVEP
jgi:hypothetical protein